MSWATVGRVVRPADHVAAARCRSRRSSRTVTDIGGNASSTGAVGGLDRRDRGGRSRDGSTMTSSPGLSTPDGDLPGVAAVVVAPRRTAAGSRTAPGTGRRRGCGRRRRARAPGGAAATGPRTRACSRERVTTLSPVQRRDRDERSGRGRRSLVANAVNSSADRARRPPREKSTRSILLTQSTRCGTRSSVARNACRRVCSTMPLRASTQDQRQVGGRGAGHHVAGVLDVPRGVGDDELAPRGGEVAVGDVDRDALLALGAQAVGEQRQVGVLVAAVAADRLDRLELVAEDRLGVVQQPADQGALAVVDGARRWRTAAGRPPSEVPLPLAVFHGGLADPVVAAGRAALGDPGRPRSRR